MWSLSRLIDLCQKKRYVYVLKHILGTSVSCFIVISLHQKAVEVPMREALTAE